MITWLNPSAWFGLALLAGPVIVHLLRRRRSRRILFPSLRFVEPSRAAAVRMHLPSDWPLLLVRLAIVAVAVSALAEPIVLTGRRVAAWDSRTVRVVVVEPTVVPGFSRTDTLIEAELKSAAYSQRIDDRDLRTAIARAVAHVDTMPPARREIVIISPFHRGTLDATDIARIPGSIGVRLVAVDTPRRAPTSAGMTLFGSGDVPTRQQTVTLGDETTAVSVAPTTGSGGLRIAGPNDAANHAAMLLRAVARAGTPAPSSAQPIAVLFDQKVSLPAERVGPGWMLDTVVRLMNDDDLQRVTSQVDATRAPASADWLVVLRDRVRRPLTSASRSNDELVLDVAVPIGSFTAAAIVRAALVARHGPVALRDREIAHIPGSELRAWARPTSPITADEGRRASASDGRWLWGGVLLLLAVEALIRRPRAAPVQTVEANAA